MEGEHEPMHEQVQELMLERRRLELGRFSRVVVEMRVLPKSLAQALGKRQNFVVRPVQPDLVDHGGDLRPQRQRSSENDLEGRPADAVRRQCLWEGAHVWEQIIVLDA